jgi:hypothetical protein
MFVLAKEYEQRRERIAAVEFTFGPPADAADLPEIEGGQSA